MLKFLIGPINMTYLVIFCHKKATMLVLLLNIYFKKKKF